MKTKTILSLIACCLGSVAFANEPGSAYVKNSGTEIMHLWVNGAYQGYLKPGETRYAISDGFITNDSGNGRTGNPVKESHAGWENTSKDKVSITYQFQGGEKKTSDASADERGQVIFGATNREGSQPKLPSDEERENAPAIIKGSKANLDGSDKRLEPEDSDVKGLPIAAFGTWISSDTYPDGRLARSTFTLNKGGTGRFRWKDPGLGINDDLAITWTSNGKQISWDCQKYSGTLLFQKGRIFQVDTNGTPVGEGMSRQ